MHKPLPDSRVVLNPPVFGSISNSTGLIWIQIHQLNSIAGARMPCRGGHRISDRGGGGRLFRNNTFSGIRNKSKEKGSNLKKKRIKTQEKKDQNSRKRSKLQEKGANFKKKGTKLKKTGI